MIPVELTDEFTEPTGQWENYAAINPEQNEALREQKHVDIRSFVPDKPAAQVNMLLMDRLSMYTLDGFAGTPWNSTVEYQIGAVVEYEIGEEKHTYRAIAVSTNKVPTNATYWTQIESPGAKLARISDDATPPARVIVKNNEGWSYGEVGPQSDRNNWNGITVVCKANQTTATQSVITE